MARRLHPLWVAAIAVLAGLGGLAGGYELRGSSGASEGPPGPASGSQVLSVTAAGTLGTAMPQIGNLLVNESPGVSAPSSAQLYQGSLSALAQITQAHGYFDVAAVADYRLIPHLLAPSFARWEVVFASDPEVLTYDPSVAALQGLNSSNWPAKLLGLPSGEYVGFANASSDPNGYNEIFVLELATGSGGGTSPDLYARFFSGPMGGLAVPDAATVRIEPETEVASLLSSHTVAAFITYRSYALAHHLAFVPLDPSLDLGSFDAASLASYARVSTEILSANGSLTAVSGAPVAFAATVPTNAPNATLGLLAVHLLLSPAGAAILSEQGFTALPSPYGWGGSALPALLAPEVEPLPAELPTGI
jgi:molybdate/tungstate transport system substrate-binding protein